MRDIDRAISAIHPFMAGRRDLTQQERDLISSVESHADERVITAAARVSYKMLREAVNLEKMKWDRLEEIEALTAKTDNPVRQMLAYLRHMRTNHDVLAKHKLKSYSKLGGEKAAVVSDLDTAYKSVAGKITACDVVNTLQQAKVMSLTDRDQAAALFRRAIKEDAEFIKFNENERGVTTYFSESDVMSVADEPQDDLFAKLKSALAQRDETLAAPQVNLVWSVDPRFLRFHGAYWMNLAPFLMSQGYGLVFVVVGDEAEANKAIDEARNLAKTLIAFRGQPDVADKYARSITFVTAPVPEYVAAAKTFYACARYFFIETILRATNAPALVIDIDMMASDLLKNFVDQAFEYDFGCPISGSVSSLYPWRKYIANTVFIKNTPMTEVMFGEVRRYIRRGLTEPVSWTLDQNALTFVIERALEKGLKMVDFSELARPLSQGPLGPMFERGI